MTGLPELPAVAHRLPPCADCRHWRPEMTNYRLCAAFPDGIPDVIWLRLRQHRRPVAGDHGIRFQPLAAREEV